jgi:ATP-dependent Lon protease
MSDILEVFVFPLRDVVFYPRATLPLNIFEPRYIAMVNDAIEKKIPIAMVQSQLVHSDDPKESRFMGLVAGMGHPQIIHKNEDGSMIILLKGVGKVSLLESVSETPYVVCRAAPLKEATGVNPENLFRLNRMKKLIKQWAELQIEDTSERQQFLKILKSEEKILESASMIFMDDPLVRQQILEMNDINERINFMTDRMPSLQSLKAKAQ